MRPKLETIICEIRMLCFSGVVVLLNLHIGVLQLWNNLLLSTFKDSDNEALNIRYFADRVWKTSVLISLSKHHLLFKRVFKRWLLFLLLNMKCTQMHDCVSRWSVITYSNSRKKKFPIDIFATFFSCFAFCSTLVHSKIYRISAYMPAGYFPVQAKPRRP